MRTAPAHWRKETILHLNKQLREKTRESMAAVLPITAIVFLLSITIAPLAPGTLVLFLFGAILLVGGMGLFTLGVEMSMTPMGEGMGGVLSQSRRTLVPVLVYFLLGVLSTVAEPDLQVLAEQVPSIDNLVLILTVAVGVGFFLVVATQRVKLGIPLRRLLLIFYLLVFALAAFAPGNFIPVSFDSGGVTTGPITVPFIMALGLGVASSRSDKNSASDSFGLVSLCSIGPILSVLLLGILYRPEEATSSQTLIPQVDTTAQAAHYFWEALPDYFGEVALALLPIAGIFLVFQVISRWFKGNQLLRVGAGLIYTYLGLVLFLCGVNVGFMPVGSFIGQLGNGNAHEDAPPGRGRAAAVPQGHPHNEHQREGKLDQMDFTVQRVTPEVRAKLRMGDIVGFPEVVHVFFHPFRANDTANCAKQKEICRKKRPNRCICAKSVVF